MKSRVASLVVLGCLPLFVNLYSCSLGHYFFISSLLASSQLEEINKEMLNKILKKLITIHLKPHM